ncbi:putative odorant receptor 85e [Maniola jurtina]|uniref:putative odorant receptor 85e n=1 Tax=Maniola jurtina TaxID=191418 RepID=UPI001E68A8CA|nr:putative odorant receptor 85e [Maniola jurtina]
MFKHFELTTDKAESVTDKVSNYTHYMEAPLKCVGCWDWYKKPLNEFQIGVNNIYLSFTLFMLAYSLLSLIVHLYCEWSDIMASLDIMADGLPLVATLFIVFYFASCKSELYELVNYMNGNFKWHSARGLTNMTMTQAYKTARNFGYFYTSCTLFSVGMYTFMPVVVHLWTKQPLQHWIYEDVTQGLIVVLIFLRQFFAQGFVGLAIGQLGVLVACNAILLCGQLDLLCCSLRNVRYTALLQHGVSHSALASQFSDIELDEEHHYLYNRAEMSDSCYNYDKRWTNKGNKMHFDIFSSVYDNATTAALKDCARMSQVVNEFKDRFEKLVSPLLALRVIQVTLYLCTLLYAASLKLDMLTVEYLAAVALDMFVYCYFGNQIILQADRVSLAGYQSAWSSMGVKPRRLLLNILLANRKPMLVRAGGFLAMNLQTFVLIIKTSFSYYTLLANVNE